MASSVKQKRPMKKKAIKKPQSYDYTVLFVVITLVFFGIIMIFSSSYYYTLTSSKFNNDMYYLKNRYNG